MAKAATELPQLGIASVAASLHDKGHEVRVADFFLENIGLQGLMNLIETNQYDMVGFYVYITTESKTFSLAQEIRALFPTIKICVGGPQVTLAAENFKKDYIDYVFLGEADLTIFELIERIESGELYPDNIEGLVCNFDGKYLVGINHNSLVQDLDKLPLFDLEQYYDLSHYYPPIHIRGNKVINTSA